MVKLGLPDNFKHKVLQWYSVTVLMKEPVGLIGQTYVTSSEMYEMLIQTSEPVSIREYTDRLVKILDSTYAKADL